MRGKSHILAEIKRLAEANGGKPPGSRAFEQQTGIKKAEWFPDHWLKWGDAQEAAGFAPNLFTEAFTNDFLLERYAKVAQQLGHIPIEGELIREKRADSRFPNPKAFQRFGGKPKLLKAVAAFCSTHAGFDDVLALCEGAVEVPNSDARDARKTKISTGFVYLMKSGPHYKIGRTNSMGRREWELGIKIPVPPKTIHSIETDDPVGVEAYWHKRFDAKRRSEGEWFNLTSEDVLTFKRWKRIV